MLTAGRATIVMGVQFGDEGKGKIVDVLSESADLVCRVQGGNNAGHTIWIGKQKIVTHLLPSGILRPEKKVAIGAGVVLDPLVLLKEIKSLEDQGISISPDRLWIDARAHVIMPKHRLFEKSSEEQLAKDGAAIGTTGRGIGPTYASKAHRDGPRVADILSRERLEAFFERHPDYREGFASSEALEEFIQAGGRIAPFVTDAAVRSQEALKKGLKVLIEGAQGAMLDVAFGTYPYVTSSSLIAGSAAGGLGIPPTSVGHIVGVTKAYATRVGNGPFVGELSGSVETLLREKGQEFGATTGRPRRIGWLDLVALRYFTSLNGLTDLVLMKPDVLSGFDQVGLVSDYLHRKNQKSLGALDWPTRLSEWSDIEASISYHPGWTDVFNVDNTFNEKQRTGKTSGKEDLHKNLASFIRLLETQVGVPIRYVSTGPERSEGVWI